MLILDATTKSLEIDLDGAVATTQLPFQANFVDVTTTAYTPGQNDGATNSTTAVTLVAAPAASTQRQVKLLTVYNADTASAIVTVQYNNNATLRTLVKITLAVGSTLVYTDGEGWRVITSAGQISSGGGAPDNVDYVVGTANATLSAERVITNSTSITWDTSVAGQVQVQRAALTGDVTASANANATTIAANAVSDTKLRDSGALSVIGRSANSSGDPADISATAASDAVFRESGSALGFGTIATAGIANDAVTYAKIQNASAASVLLGRGSAGGSGDYQEITTAGNLAISGTTITNIPRVTATTSSATPTPNADTTDAYELTALAEAAAFGAPTGTPVNFQKLLIRIKDNGTARALTWNAAFVAGGTALPTTTVISKILTVGFIYNTANSLNKWQCVGSQQEA